MHIMAVIVIHSTGMTVYPVILSLYSEQDQWPGQLPTTPTDSHRVCQGNFSPKNLVPGTNIP